LGKDPKVEQRPYTLIFLKNKKKPLFEESLSAKDNEVLNFVLEGSSDSSLKSVFLTSKSLDKFG